jgi:serine/threonine protein kinase
VSNYEIREKLGTGGMGVVFKAMDTKLGRAVALKFLPANLCAAGHARDRFLREAKTASALDHPNIGTIYGIEETPAGDLFIVMAYYDGLNLEQRMRGAPLARAASNSKRSIRLRNLRVMVTFLPPPILPDRPPRWANAYSHRPGRSLPSNGIRAIPSVSLASSP